MAGDEARVLDDGPGVAAEEGEINLVAMGMASQHEVPRVVQQRLFGIGIVVEEDGGAGAGGLSEGALGLDLPGPKVADTDEIQAFKLGGFVVQEMNSSGREARSHDCVIDFARLGVMMRAIVIAESGEGGCGVRKAAEDVFKSRVVAYVRVVDVVAGETDEVGLLGEGEVDDVVQVVE